MQRSYLARTFTSGTPMDPGSFLTPEVYQIGKKVQWNISYGMWNYFGLELVTSVIKYSVSRVPSALNNLVFNLVLRLSRELLHHMNLSPLFVLYCTCVYVDQSVVVLEKFLTSTFAHCTCTCRQ